MRLVKLVTLSLLTCLIASTVTAEMTPGFVVTAGAPFPIVADFNGDGLDDLFQERSLILNSGGALAARRDYPIPEGEKVVGVADVNGDGRIDLITVGTPVMYPAFIQPQPAMQTPGYRLYIADASRNYSASIGLSSGARPYVVDVDRNGSDDFLMLADISNEQRYPIATEVTVLRSKGDGTFESLAPFRIPALVQAYPEHRLQAGDVDHDGAVDVVLRTVNELVVLKGTGDGHFSAKSRFLPQNDEFGVRSLRLGDVDGDSHLDVVLPGMRSVRVFFGDGRGNFPRSTRGRIAKVHDIIGLPPGVNDGSHGVQPRNVVLGHFTRGDQLQIAAGTGEGDIVVLAYEQGTLREVSRTVTEFWMLELREGSFHGTGATDLYVTGTLIWGENWPKPRLFHGSNDVAAAGTATRSAGRRRSAGLAPGMALRMQMQAECVESFAGRFDFAREGLFGTAQRGGTTIEAVFDESNIYYRMNGPFSGETVFGKLEAANGTWKGTASVLTSCGWKVMTVDAAIE